MSKVLIGFFFLTIILSSIDYVFKMSFLTSSREVTTKLIYSESRNIKLIQLFQNIRSYLNIANGIEFGSYSDDGLKRIDRLVYLR